MRSHQPSCLMLTCSRALQTCLAIVLAACTANAATPEYDFVDLYTLTGQILFPRGISNDGTIVGAAGEQGFVFRNGTLAYVELPELGVNLTGINPNGTTCTGIYWDPADRPLGFVYSLVDGTFRFLPDLGGPLDSTVPRDINDTGLVVGSIDRVGENNVGQAFTIQGDDIRTYSAPGARYTEFGGVNNTGQIVGYWNATQHGEDHPFILEGDTLTPLPLTFQSRSTEVTDINNRGQIVGWGHHTGLGIVGFLKDGEDEALFRYPQQIPDWTRFTGINDSGVIVGYRYEPGPRGFIAYPKHAIPEPSSLALLLAGAPLVALRRRRG